MGPNEAVLKYLCDQNRPYSANDIFMNLHKEFGKTAVQKSLDHLVEKGKIKEKIYGKQKVYAILQEDRDSATDMGQELNNLDAQIVKLSTDLDSKEREFRISENHLRDLLLTPTTAVALQEQEQLKERLMRMRQKLQHLSENTASISEKDKQKIKTDFERHIKEWRKRKSLCMDIVNSVLEGYPKGKKALLEEVGIETDDDVGVTIPSM